MEYESETRPYDDEARGYDRDRSRSPGPDRRDDGESRVRSGSPNGREADDRAQSAPQAPLDDEEEARNSGSNLFVTGIHPRLSEQDVTRLFEKYGEVEKCNIMRDPHTRESRGFGFVNMMTAQQADAAKEGLQGEVYEGRTLSIEKARRSRPRTPTPGKYFGPPKRGDFRGPPRGRYGDRYDDRRGYGGRRDDGPGYRGSRQGDRYDDRSYSRRDRDDGYRGGDRYGSSRDDRYGGRDSRRGGDYYERDAPRGPPAASYGDGATASRSYEERGDDRYSRR